MFSGRRVRDDPAMDDTPILICYDGSANAARAIRVAAALLGPRRSVVLDIAPPITPTESLAAIGPLVPGDSFEDLNRAQAAEKPLNAGALMSSPKRSRNAALARLRRSRASGVRPSVFREPESGLSEAKSPSEWGWRTSASGH